MPSDRYKPFPPFLGVLLRVPNCCMNCKKPFGHDPVCYVNAYMDVPRFCTTCAIEHARDFEERAARAEVLQPLPPLKPVS